MECLPAEHGLCQTLPRPSQKGRAPTHASAGPATTKQLGRRTDNPHPSSTGGVARTCQRVVSQVQGQQVGEGPGLWQAAGQAIVLQVHSQQAAQGRKSGGKLTPKAQVLQVTECGRGCDWGRGLERTREGGTEHIDRVLRGRCWSRRGGPAGPWYVRVQDHGRTYWHFVCTFCWITRPLPAPWALTWQQRPHWSRSPPARQTRFRSRYWGTARSRDNSRY